jgi:hypothetical protein
MHISEALTRHHPPSRSPWLHVLLFWKAAKEPAFNALLKSFKKWSVEQISDA